MKTLIGQIWPFTPKIKQSLRLICPKDKKMMEMSRMKTHLMKAMQNILQSEGKILSCTKNPKMMKELKI